MNDYSLESFELDLNEVLDEKVLLPAGIYPGMLTKGEVKEGKNDDEVPWLMFNITIALNSDDARKMLGIDNPKVFFSGFLRFTPESHSFNKTGSPEFGNFIKVTGFTDINDFKDGTESCKTQFEYMKVVLKNMLSASVGTLVDCKVVKIAANEEKGFSASNRVSKLLIPEQE